MARSQPPEPDDRADRAPYPLRQQLPRLRLSRVAEWAGPGASRGRADRLLQVEPVAGGWLVTVEGGDQVQLLDERLSPRRQLAIPTPIVAAVAPHVGVDATGSVFAVSHRSGLRVFGAPDGDAPRLLWDLSSVR